MIGVLLADPRHELGVDGRSIVFPFAADVREDAGHLFVAQHAHWRHGEVPGTVTDFHGATEAVEDNVLEEGFEDPCEAVAPLFEVSKLPLELQGLD